MLFSKDGNRHSSSGGVANPLFIQSPPPSAGAKGNAFNLGTRSANKDTNINGYQTPFPREPSKIKIEYQPESCGDIGPSAEQSGNLFAPYPGEGSNEPNGDARPGMELDGFNRGTFLSQDCESTQDAAFWGVSSDSDCEPESTNVKGEPSSPSMQPEVQVRMEEPPNPKQSLGGMPTIHDKQFAGKARPQAANSTKTHLSVPRPRSHPGTVAPYIVNENSRQSIIQSDDVVDTLSDERYVANHPNRTSENHNSSLKAAVKERWDPLSGEEKQVYLAKCFRGWRCFYCQTMEISNGCISQVSKFDCPTTMRRGVPCHVASYDEEKGLYSWRKLPRRRKLPQDCFDDVYFIICGRGRPKAEQQFLERMFQTRNRCLNCMLDTKTHKKGDRCLVQRLSKPESQGEEFLETCTKCARNQESCMISIPMNPDANGKPANYGLGKVISGGVEALGPRFLIHRQRSGKVPSTPVATIQTGPEDGGLGDGGLANMCDSSQSKNPEIRRVRSAVDANPPLAQQAVKRTTSMPEHRSNALGESSTAGGASEFIFPENKAPECPSMHPTPGRKRDHSPTMTAQEKSQKSKVRRLPAHDSPLSFVHQLKDGYLARPVEYDAGSPQSKPVVSRRKY